MKEKATIDAVYPRPTGAMLPTLLTFQNGKMCAISKEHTKYCQIENKVTKEREALVVSGDQIYRGPIASSDSNDLTDNYILVRNKKTNKVRIIPVDRANLTNIVYDKIDKQREQQMVNSTITKEMAQKTLLKQFGGRKASRFVNNREEMKMSIDVVRQELDSTVQEASLIGEELNTSVDNDKYLESIRPPFNQEARNTDEVYNVEDIIPADLLQRLEDEAKVVYSTSPENLPIKSEYLLECIKKIQSKSITSPKDFLHIKLIIYMDALQALISTRSRNLKKAELSGITEKVENDIRQRFSDPNLSQSCARTTYSTEKAITYFIVLAMLISDKNEIDINTLSTALNTNKKKIKMFAHTVNALPKARTDLLTLRLPSDVPPLPTSSGFSRRK